MTEQHHPGWTGKTVAVDFDGVIHSYTSGWTGPRPTDPPVEGAREFIDALHNAGFNVVIYSSRADTPRGRKHIEHWLLDHEFPVMEITDRKPMAVAYVDDRAVPYSVDRPWADVLTDVEKLAGIRA